MISRRASLAAFLRAPLAAVAPMPPSSRDAIRNRYFPNLPLVTHQGERVRFYDDLIKDKIVLLNFMYANCEGICPGIMMNLANVHRALGDRMGRDTFFYSITLKPAHDSPAVLEDYAAMHGVGRGWLLLTGAPADIELLRRKLGYVDPDPVADRDVSTHIGMVRFGNEPRQLWGACPGLAAAGRLVQSIASVDWPRQGGEGR
jgi:protein SCO1/2